MKIEKSVSDSYTTIRLLDPRLDSRISADVKSEFIVLSAEGILNLIVDMSEVQYADSSGLSAMLVGNRLFKDAGGAMVVCGLTDHVAKLVGIAQLDKVLNIVPTEEEAREALFLLMLQQELTEEGEDEAPAASAN